MLIPREPAPDFSTFSFDHLAEYSQVFREALENGGVTEESFLKLEPERIAGALNIEAKLRNTNLSGITASRFLQQFKGTDEIFQDRIYVWVDKYMPQQVRMEIDESQSFTELPEWANELFHEGYPISFKQRVPFGSLQLSFAEAVGIDELLAADIDIDLYTDIGHLGEVVRNKITNQKTDPFTVYVQLFDQRIFPLYVLKTG